MKSLFLTKKEKYTGQQLEPLRNYLVHKLLGDSVVSWIGACDVSFEHMVDGEDLLAQDKICGDLMLHFVFEIFSQSLATGVFLQRLFASVCKDEIEQHSGKKLLRKGDDLYWNGKKLSISIAAPSVNSVLVHFALNISNEGTPVKTCSLEDFKIDPKKMALSVMKKFCHEYESILTATQKVRSV
jgi:hypothetical protein